MQKVVTPYRYKDLDLDFGIHPVKKDVDTVIDEVAINRALRNLLFTKYYEKPFQPLFGSGISDMLFEPIDYIVASNLETAIRISVQNFEPRVTILAIESTPDYDNNGYSISIKYRINNALQENRVSEFKFFLDRIR